MHFDGNEPRHTRDVICILFRDQSHTIGHVPYILLGSHLISHIHTGLTCEDFNSIDGIAKKAI